MSNKKLIRKIFDDIHYIIRNCITSKPINFKNSNFKEELENLENLEKEYLGYWYKERK